MRRMAPHLPSLGSLGTPAEACAISRYCKGFGWSWCTALCCRTDDGKQLNSQRSHHKRHLVGGVGGGPAHVVGDDPASSASSHLCPFAGVIGHRRFMGSPAGPSIISIISIIVPQGSLDTGRFSCMFLKLPCTRSRGRCSCCFKPCAGSYGVPSSSPETPHRLVLVRVFEASTHAVLESTIIYRHLSSSRTLTSLPVQVCSIHLQSNS